MEISHGLISHRFGTISGIQNAYSLYREQIKLLEALVPSGQGQRRISRVSCHGALQGIMPWHITWYHATPHRGVSCHSTSRGIMPWHIAGYNRVLGHICWIKHHRVSHHGTCWSILQQHNAHDGVSCYRTSQYIMPQHMMGYHATTHHGVSFHVTSWVSCHPTLWGIISPQIVGYHAQPYCGVSRHATLMYHSRPHHEVSCHATSGVSCHSTSWVSCHGTPRGKMPCHIMGYHATSHHGYHAMTHCRVSRQVTS